MSLLQSHPRLATATDGRPNRAAGRAASRLTSPTVQWKKGWTPWGTPCSVLVVDGYAFAAHATEKSDCPLARLAE